MPKTDIMLELFSGTGSVGRAGKRAGFKKIISIDNEEKFKPTYTANLLTFDYKKLPTPDFIWASPPCVSFSILNNSMKEPHRDTKTMAPRTETGRIGNRLLARTLTIIKYFQKKNPSLKFVIENPRGYMRRMPSLKNIPRFTTSYSQYGFDYNKPTDFWSNIKLNLKPVDTKANPSKMKQQGKMSCGGAQGQSKETLYRIPQPLLSQIFRDYKKS